MTRILILIGVALIALSVLSDPYTYHLNGSDGFVTAPRWQTDLVLADIALLVASGVLVLRRLWRAALFTLAGELLYALAYNMALIHRDGFERFSWGLGAQSHVADFVVVFGLRLLVLFALLRSLKQPKSRAA